MIISPFVPYPHKKCRSHACGRSTTSNLFPRRGGARNGAADLRRFTLPSLQPAPTFELSPSRIIPIARLITRAARCVHLQEPEITMGPQTKQNLNAAMQSEAFSHVKYLRFAAHARMNEHWDLAQLFDEAADAARTGISPKKLNWRAGSQTTPRASDAQSRKNVLTLHVTNDSQEKRKHTAILPRQYFSKRYKRMKLPN